MIWGLASAYSSARSLIVAPSTTTKTAALNLSPAAVLQGKCSNSLNRGGLTGFATPADKRLERLDTASANMVLRQPLRPYRELWKYWQQPAKGPDDGNGRTDAE